MIKLERNLEIKTFFITFFLCCCPVLEGPKHQTTETSVDADWCIYLNQGADLRKESFYLLFPSWTGLPLDLQLLRKPGGFCLHALQFRLHSQDVLLQVSFFRADPLQLTLLLKELLIQSACRTRTNVSSMLWTHRLTCFLEQVRTGLQNIFITFFAYNHS